MKPRLKVIKIGGNIIENKRALSSFLIKFSQLEGNKILVHGGGKSTTKWSKKIGVETKMFEGRRITDAPTLELITMICGGSINRGIVAQLQTLNCNAIGLSGADAKTITSKKRPVKECDFGFVGDITSVNTNNIKTFIDNKMIPVFCPITYSTKEGLLNVNSDTIASKIAISMGDFFTVELYYCFEKKGVLKDINDDKSIISDIDKKTYNNLVKDNIITEGMLPKIQNCFSALEKNVSKVCIGSPQMIEPTNSIYTNVSL